MVIYVYGAVGLAVCSDLLLGVVRWIDRELLEFVGVDLLFVIDRRRLILWYGCMGEPLRRYYPVVGFTECTVVLGEIVLVGLYSLSENMHTYDWFIP